MLVVYTSCPSTRLFFFFLKKIRKKDVYSRSYLMQKEPKADQRLQKEIKKKKKLRKN